METSRQWVLLAYRLPREPSTPRITVWRKLKRLGALQVLDGLAGLPLTARAREQFEWLCQEIIEADGEASVWLASPLSAAEDRELTARLTSSIADEYRALIAAAHAANDAPTLTRPRTLARLRREPRRVGERDYVSPPERDAARAAVDALAARSEVPA
ncbi:MAG: Chromate resistance protein ChrB [Dehalococcoidia bacterium]